MKHKKLVNSPLKEVIFDLFWQLSHDNNNFPYDPEFLDFSTLFDELIKEQGFPLKKTIAKTPNLKIHPSVDIQFWTDELKWPVTQIGNGIFTFNDVSNSYEWEDSYYPKLQKAFEVLTKSHPSPLKYSKVVLKYINLFDLKSASEYEGFIVNNLSNKLPEYKIHGKFSGYNLLQSFTLSDDSVLSVAIQTVISTTTNNPAVVWVISIEKNLESSVTDIIKWADYAHNEASDFFVNMLNKDFYASLSGL